MEQPDRDQSEFNMAFAWLARLNYWLWSANDAKYNNDAYAWCKSLLILFDELSTEMLDTERQQKLQEIQTIYASVNTLVTRKQQNQLPPDLYWKLSETERWLRHLANKSGLLKKIKDDPSKALG